MEVEMLIISVLFNIYLLFMIFCIIKNHKKIRKMHINYEKDLELKLKNYIRE